MSHERYELLAALAAGGQIEERDKQDLNDHLAECPECLSVLGEFRHVADGAGRSMGHRDQPMNECSNVLENSLPRMASTRERTEAVRFLEFARSQGIRFSGDAERSLADRDRRGWGFLRIAYAAAALLLVAAALVGLTLKFAGTRVPSSSARLAQPPSVLRAPQENGSHETEVNHGETNELRLQLNKALNQIPQLRQEVAAEQKERAVLEEKLAARDAVIDQLQATAGEANRERDEAQASIASFRDKNAQTVAELSDMRIRSMNLAEDLRNEKANVEQERELSAASREVRELMGARRLFMVDVYDGADTSRSNRSFGRIFYTEGKSLIFYAFDLDKVKNGKHVTFEAWAEPGKDAGGVRHLGDFYIDDVAQKRWVMKVADPEKLKAVDAIFVTVEPGKGSTRPTGAKLLYAYLGGQPNHP